VGSGAGLISGKGLAFVGQHFGAEVFTPVGALIGVTVSALIPTGGWHDIYRAK
jgi:hypothetical protein